MFGPRVVHVDYVDIEDVKMICQEIYDFHQKMLDADEDGLRNLYYSSILDFLSRMSFMFYERRYSCLRVDWVQGKEVEETSEQMLAIGNCVHSLQDYFLKAILYEQKLSLKKQLGRMVYERRLQLPEQLISRLSAKMSAVSDNWKELRSFMFSSPHVHYMHAINLQNHKIIDRCRLLLCQDEEMLSDQDKELYVIFTEKYKWGDLTTRVYYIGSALCDWYNCWNARKNKGKNVLEPSDQQKSILDWMAELDSVLVIVENTMKKQELKEERLKKRVLTINERIQSMRHYVAQLQCMMLSS